MNNILTELVYFFWLKHVEGIDAINLQAHIIAKSFTVDILVASTIPFGVCRSLFFLSAFPFFIFFSFGGANVFSVGKTSLPASLLAS